MPTLTRPELRSDPAHSEMVEGILAGVADGLLGVGQRIAGEVSLAQQYGISVKSVKRGLGLLVERGVLTRKRGSGTFIASTDVVAPTLPLARRDTVVIDSRWAYRRYHPFFSEREKGVLAGLAAHGWKTLDLQVDNKDSAPINRTVSYRYTTSAMVEFELKQHPEVAGAIALDSQADQLRVYADCGITVIHSAPNRDAPCVYYDWLAETERLFRIALDRGARHLGVVSSRPTPELHTMCQRSIRAAGLSDDAVMMTHLACTETHEGTELMNEAFRVTRTAFQEQPDFDALIMGDDFTATGVTDALLAMPEEAWSDLIIVALLNKETKLHARIPLTALVADGYACGVAMADLLHEQITTCGHCRSSIKLSCDEVAWC